MKAEHRLDDNQILQAIADGYNSAPSIAYMVMNLPMAKLHDVQYIRTMSYDTWSTYQTLRTHYNQKMNRMVRTGELIKTDRDIVNGTTHYAIRD